MAVHKFGEIVLIKFPFTDNLTFKKRPALINLKIQMMEM